MFEESMRGVLFSKETIIRIMPRLIALTKKHGFDSVLELMSVLHDLSISRNIKILSDASFSNMEGFSYGSRRIEKIMEYINHNFSKNIGLSEVHILLL
jgi:hypothetical protein